MDPRCFYLRVEALTTVNVESFPMALRTTIKLLRGCWAQCELVHIAAGNLHDYRCYGERWRWFVVSCQAGKPETRVRGC